MAKTGTSRLTQSPASSLFTPTTKMTKTTPPDREPSNWNALKFRLVRVHMVIRPASSNCHQTDLDKNKVAGKLHQLLLPLLQGKTKHMSHCVGVGITPHQILQTTHLRPRTLLDLIAPILRNPKPSLTPLPTQVRAMDHRLEMKQAQACTDRLHLPPASDQAHLGRGGTTKRQASKHLLPTPKLPLRRDSRGRVGRR